MELYIDLLELSPLDLEIFFHNDSKSTFIEENVASNPVIFSLINTFSTINGAPLFLGGRVYSNVTGNFDEIIYTVIGEYKDNLSKQFYMIVGSIEILGNPVGLANNLSKGVKEFFEKPIKGIVKGPIEGIAGLFEGSVGLIKTGVEGVFGTASSLGSGISKGLLSLTMDKEYIHKKEMNKIKKKPKNFGEGIAYGLESAAKGLFSGISDIFMKPIEGAQEDNVVGFGKGVIKGISGAIFKPVSGIFDMFSKTTEGFKNTISDEKQEQKKRVGLILFGRYKVIRHYNDSLSKVKKAVEKMLFKNEEIDFESASLYTNDNLVKILLIFLNDQMLLIEVENNFSVKVSVPRRFLERTEMTEKKISLFFNKESGKSKSAIYFAKIEEDFNIVKINHSFEKWIAEYDE